MKRDEIIAFLKSFKESPQNTLFEQIGLFGSYARDEADEFSDIDVAVRIRRDVLARQDIWSYFDAIEQIKSALRKRFGLLTDVFDLESASALSKEIEKEIIYV